MWLTSLGLATRSRHYASRSHEGERLLEGAELRHTSGTVKPFKPQDNSNLQSSQSIIYPDRVMDAWDEVERLPWELQQHVPS